MKLFYHLFGYLLAGIVLLIGVDEYLNFRVEVRQYDHDMITSALQDGRSIAGMVNHVWRGSGQEQALKMLEDASVSGKIQVDWIWIDDIDSRRFMAEEAALLQERLAAYESVSLKTKDKPDGTWRYTYVPVDVGEERMGAVELRQPLVSLGEFSGKMILRAFLITALLGGFSGIVLYLFMDRKIGRPLKRLMAHARRIGEGDFRADVEVVGTDELAVMARTMNDMCSRLLIAKEKIKFEYDARLKTLEQLRHTERLSSFGLISAGIAHDLGTPLNVIDGRAKMIIRGEVAGDERLECAEIIRQQAERMTVIIRQLLDFTRRPKQHISLENVAVLVKQVFQLLYPMASKQHIQFSMVREDNTAVDVYIDSSQIQQVLVNLLMNGIQAMPDGGKIEVRLSNAHLPAVEAEGGRMELYLKVQIHDEGEGIEQENLEKIFTPFFTTKKIGTGTGLGLSIAHGIVEDHDGWITVESGVQHGACFTIYLPMRERNA